MKDTKDTLDEAAKVVIKREERIEIPGEDGGWFVALSCRSGICWRKWQKKAALYEEMIL